MRATLQLAGAVTWLVVLLSCRGAMSETLLLLDDAEGAIGPWSGTERVSEPVHAGRWALKWDISKRPILDSPRLLADWTAFDELRFWAWLKEPVGFSVPLVFVAPGGYYIVDWKLDWQGWKEQRIRLADCRKAHEPAGWDQITSFGFRPQGYGQGPVPEGLTLVLDDFALHSPQDLSVTSLADWIARERRERMRQLKAQGNPYYLSVLDSIKGIKAEPALPEPQALTSAWQFAGFASNALAVAWAAACEDSPRKGDATLVANACAAVDFCLKQQTEGSWFYSRKWESGDPNSDRFALGPLMDAVWWLRKLPQGQERWASWEAPLREMVEFQYTRWGHYSELGYKNNEAWGSSAFTYPNQDVFYLAIMAFAHEFWNEAKYQQETQRTLKGLEDHLLPAGGLNYIGPETEIPCYHDLNVQWLARYYKLTGDERARALLGKTVEYYPLTYSNEGRPEYYTDCWWKHYWSDGAASGPEIVAGLTGDGRNKWLADRLLERNGTGSTYAALYAGMFYRDDIKAEPLPDGYVKEDPNIRGPRGRFGTWYFAGVQGGGARDTFVGAMVCEPERAQPLNGAFLAANIEVDPGGEGPRDRHCLYISGPDDITATALLEEAAALGARYSPRRPYINSVANPTVPPTLWQATQAWLLTAQGLIGLVELEATQEQKVRALGGELRFGPDQPLTQDAEGVYHCGKVTMRLLEHNFAQATFGPARPGYAQKTTTHSAVNLRTAGEAFTARPGEPVRYAAVVAPEGAEQATRFRRLQAPGLWGFEVSLGAKPYVVAFNPGEADAEVRVMWQAAVQAGGKGLRPIPDGVAVTVGPGQVALIRTPMKPKFPGEP